MMDVLSLPNPSSYQLNTALKEALAVDDKSRAHAIVERWLLSPTNDGIGITEALRSVLDMTVHPNYPVDPQLVQLLLENGVSVQGYYGTSSLLYLALVSGNKQAASMVSDAGADIHASQRDPYHYLSDVKSMLVWAIEAGQTEAALRMIEAGADLHGVPEWPRPLQAAARHGNMAVAQALLERGVEVNARHSNAVKPVNSSGSYRPSETALMEAAKIDGNPVLELLLSHGADVNAQSDEGWTALHFTIWATRSGYTFAPRNVESLLSSGATPGVESGGGETLLIRALRHLVAYNGEHYSETVSQIINALLAHGSDPNQNTPYGESPLKIAVGYNDIQSVLLLLKAGAKVLELATSLWLMALESEDQAHSALSQFLKEHRLELDFTQLPVLFEEAIGHGDTERVKLLIEKGVDSNGLNGDTPLHDAAEFGFADIVEELLRAGANPSIQESSSNSTPLMLALDHKRDRGGSSILQHFQPIGDDLIARAIKQDLSIVTALLKAGTDLRVKRTDGYTALHMAALTSSPPVLKALLEAGADVGALSEQGRIPLLTLVGGGRRKKLLEEFPFHIDNRSEELRLATEWDEEAARLLIGSGSDVNAEGSDSFNVLSLAALYATPKTVRMLIDAGATPHTLVGGWPLPSLVLSLGRTASLFKEHGFSFDCFQWLEEDMKQAAQGQLPLSDLIINARPQLAHAIQEDVTVLQHLLRK